MKPLLWVLLLGISALGEVWCFVSAATFAVTAVRAAGGEQTRLAAAAVGWFAGSLLFTATGLVALVRLLRHVARQVPSVSDDERGRGA